ncbi:hypothetical protein KBY22_02710 [Ruegeria pomeroyi]|nr:hypothetical protein [Ruegeria pomeroyi]MCE8527741.1 hypothetical protein [Ruegeria pomeroyi]
MRPAFYLLSGSAIALMILSSLLFLFTSDFDKFARATIRELGHNSDPQQVTDAVLRYLEQKRIDDPIAFFGENMDETIVLKADDPKLADEQRRLVARADAKLLTSFSSKYFRRPLANYELQVRVWDLYSGDREITTQIYLNAP